MWSADSFREAQPADEVITLTIFLSFGRMSQQFPLAVSPGDTQGETTPSENNSADKFQ